jgi:hypothetical protein
MYKNKINIFCEEIKTKKNIEELNSIINEFNIFTQ